MFIVFKFHRRRRAVIHFLVSSVVATAAGSVFGSEFFAGGASNPEFLRDVQTAFVGGNQTAPASTGDGQDLSITLGQLGAGTDVWNNERNQVLAGVEYTVRRFGNNIALPEGFSLPLRMHRVSASLHYRHITSGDWVLNQSMQYSKSLTDDNAISVNDTIDLIGLVATTTEPGVGWMFGYSYSQTDSIEPHLLPVIQFIYAKASDRWAVMLGYPGIIGFSYFPHPDWVVGGGGAAVSYKITPSNILRLSYAGDTWAYPLRGPNMKSVDYAAQRVALNWSVSHGIDHHTFVGFNTLLGWEFDRKLGADKKITADDAAVFGIQMSIVY